MRWVSRTLPLAAALACAEWAGPRLERQGPSLNIVPLFSVTAGAVLLNDLDRLRVTVRRLPTATVVADTTVPVDAAGDADITVSVLLLGVSERFEVALRGIRSSDGTALYSGMDTVVVTAAAPTPPDSVPVTYLGPCQLGAGCRVLVGPQGLTLPQAGSLVMTVAVDSVGLPVPGVPVTLANVTPSLIGLGRDLTVTALSGTSCGPARVAAAIRGATDTLRLAILAPVTTPAVLFAGDSAGGLSSGIFCANLDRTGRFKISANGATGDVSPRWSPDRQRVAYTFRPAGAFPQPNELLVARWAGDTEAVVVRDTSVSRPRWSPNGRHLAFTCGDGFSPDQDVCVMLDATGPIVSLPNAPRVFLTDVIKQRVDGPSAFAWDPLNPDRLAFVRDSFTAAQQTTSAIYTAGVDGSGLQQLTRAPLDVGRGVLRIDEIDWSPRGDVIVFAATDTAFVRKLYLINRDGTGLRQLTSGADFDSRPVVSPDGVQIVFLRSLASACSLDYWRIRVDGTGAQQVSSEGFCGVSTGPLGHDWSPDGQALVLVGRGAAGGFAVYTVPATTTAATYPADRVLVSRGVDPGGFVNDIQPSWRP